MQGCQMQMGVVLYIENFQHEISKILSHSSMQQYCQICKRCCFRYNFKNIIQVCNNIAKYANACCFDYNFKDIIAFKYVAILTNIYVFDIISKILSHPSMHKYAAILPNMQRGCGCSAICQAFPPSPLLLS